MDESRLDVLPHAILVGRGQMVPFTSPVEKDR